MRKREWALLLVLVIGIVGSIGIGRYGITPLQVLEVLLGKEQEGRIVTLIWQIRLPRVLMVTLSGMALGLSGLLYQKVFRNPLVSPDLLGASSGASVGAALAIVFIGGMSIYVPLLALVSSFVMVGATLYLANNIEKGTLGLVLAGIVITAISSALLMLLKVVADPYRDLPSIEFWLMGGFYNSQWQGILVLSSVTLIGSVGAFLLAYPLELLALGDDTAQALGLSVQKIRYVTIGIGTFLVAFVIALSGLVSWIGLIAPHVARLYSGNFRGRRGRYKEFLMTMLWGGILLLVADTLCRVLLPSELPISVMTSLMGGILLGYLLIQKKHKGGI